MKMIKYLSIPLALAAMNVAIASPAPKQISIPFNNEAIVSGDHSGLVFNYAMNAQPQQKVVCKLSNVYKSWFVFSDQGIAKQSGVFGEYETVIFTNKGQDDSSNDAVATYHADASGEMIVNETLSSKANNATASCYYAADDSVKK